MKKLQIGNVTLDNPVILAPMAGVSDLPFRLLCREMGAALVCMEMVSAKAIYYNNKNTDSLMEIHPETAAKYGIKDGDWVWMEGPMGRAKRKAKLTPVMDRRIVSCDHGWWFPETEGAEPNLYGVFDSNINNLTPQCENGDTGFGAPYANQLCRVYPCTEENSRVLPGEQVTRRGGYSKVIDESNGDVKVGAILSLIHISEPTRP